MNRKSKVIILFCFIIIFAFLNGCASSGTKTLVFQTKYSKIRISYDTPKGYEIYYPITNYDPEKYKDRVIRGPNNTTEYLSPMEVAKDDGEIVLYVDFPNKNRYRLSLAKARILSKSKVHDIFYPYLYILDEYEKNGNKYLLYSYQLVDEERIEYRCLISFGGSNNQSINCYSLTSEEELRKWLDIISFSFIEDTENEPAYVIIEE